MNPAEKINIVIIEDIEDIRETLREYLEYSGQAGLVRSFESMESFFKSIDETEAPDIVLCDIVLPGMNGIDGIRAIKNVFPDADIIMLTVFDDNKKIFNSLCAGATGYLLKGTPLPEISKIIRLVKDGGSYMSPSIARKVTEYFLPQKKNIEDVLTEKEKQIVGSLTEGLSYKLIADRLNISIDTVRFHIKKIYRKLHVNSKAEVISKAFRGEI